MTRELGLKYLWYIIVASPLYDEIIATRKQLKEAEDTIRNQQKTIDELKAKENARGKRVGNIYDTF